MERIAEMSIKKIDIKEFREIGLLQEINRLFLHPLGLALEVNIDDKTEEETLGGIWDCRDDPEGIFFGKNIIDPTKIHNVQKLMEYKAQQREEVLGYIIQKK